MISVKRDLWVSRSIDDVWEFVKDMQNWATQMPGYVSHEQINDNDSVWKLQVNLGPFARPIVIDVHVENWEAPTHVAFHLKGKSDPFFGGGSFHAGPGVNKTDIHLEFTAEPTGSMKTVLNAMATPVLEAIGTQFSANLKQSLEGESTRPATPPGPLSVWKRFVRRITRIFSNA